MSNPSPPTDPSPGVERWPATVAVLLIGGLYLLLSDRFSIGPRWLVPLVAAGLLIPLWVFRLRGHAPLTHFFARLMAIVLTLAVIASAATLFVLLLRGEVGPLTLLRNAGVIWLVNIVTFALWYWEIDGGGPARRHPGRHASTDFAFPQQQQEDDGVVEGWSPTFIDYLFLAFNTSTAFSPTDTLVLSRLAKVLLMLQSLISLTVLAVLAAAAINKIAAG